LHVKLLLNYLIIPSDLVEKMEAFQLPHEINMVLCVYKLNIIIYLLLTAPMNLMVGAVTFVFVAFMQTFE